MSSTVDICREYRLIKYSQIDSPLLINENDGVILFTTLFSFATKSLFDVSFMERRRLPKEGSDLPDCPGQYAFKRKKN